ncbi:ABC transporter permease [Actinomyces sp. oral taxon 897]|mgnify:FL=1|uniref:ABC transporter permease n=1 Tax=Actinomyces sp. oral taxon 897 TaxID=2081702 RepID=UPI000D0387B4|nr:ABC transporter permease [Actinomyces sp. oral taxon 897]AVM60757.1 ABC transporter permease [Actinomyces sp. oral taxon 897]
MSTLLLEVRKIRRKHYWLMAAGASVLLVLWSSGLAATRAGRGPDSAKVAVMNLHEAFQLITLFGPVVVAILASRLVTVDTEARMGQMMTALGQHATTRFWGKLVVVGLTVVLAEGAVIGFAVVNASVMGLSVTPSYHASLGPIVLLLLGSAIAVPATQIALSTCVSRQAVGVVAACLGGLTCSALPYLHLGYLGWFTPWGLGAAADPVDTLASQTTFPLTGDMAMSPHPWLTASLALLAAAAWTAVAYLAVARKENRR